MVETYIYLFLVLIHYLEIVDIVYTDSAPKYVFGTSNHPDPTIPKSYSGKIGDFK